MRVKGRPTLNGRSKVARLKVCRKLGVGKASPSAKNA